VITPSTSNQVLITITNAVGWTNYELYRRITLDLNPLTLEPTHPCKISLTLYSATATADENGVARGFIGYVFEESYEMVPGQWNMSLIFNRKILLQKSFTVKAL
jgi:hypothetical protein